MQRMIAVICLTASALLANQARCLGQDAKPEHSAPPPSRGLFAGLGSEVEKENRALAAFEKLLAGFPVNILKVRVVTATPRIVSQGEAGLEAEWDLEITIDNEKYFQDFVPALSKVLSDVTLLDGVPRSRLAFSSSGDETWTFFNGGKILAQPKGNPKPNAPKTAAMVVTVLVAQKVNSENKELECDYDMYTISDRFRKSLATSMVREPVLRVVFLDKAGKVILERKTEPSELMAHDWPKGSPWPLFILWMNESMSWIHPAFWSFNEDKIVELTTMRAVGEQEPALAAQFQKLKALEAELGINLFAVSPEIIASQKPSAKVQFRCKLGIKEAQQIFEIQAGFIKGDGAALAPTPSTRGGDLTNLKDRQSLLENLLTQGESAAVAPAPTTSATSGGQRSKAASPEQESSTPAAEPAPGTSLKLENATDTDLTGLKTRQDVLNLDLSYSKVTDAGLANLKEMSGLQTLDLGFTEVTDAGLVNLKKLKGLQTLLLNGTKVTNAGLAQLKEMTGLRTLDLGGTRVTDAGVAQLKEMRGLTELSLSYTKVTDAGVANLKAALPNTKIVK
jgi:hypothetical protein